MIVYLINKGSLVDLIHMAALGVLLTVVSAVTVQSAPCIVKFTLAPMLAASQPNKANHIISNCNSGQFFSIFVSKIMHLTCHL